MTHLIFLFFIGIISGIFTGFFGVGGGFFLTPVLNILGLPIITAIGTVFFALVGNSLLGAAQHLKQRHVTLRLGIFLGVFSIAGVEIGKRIVLHLDKHNLAETSIRIAYIVILILIALSMLKDCFSQRKQKTQQSTENDNVAKKKCAWPIQLVSKITLPPKIYLPYSELGYVSFWVLIAAGFLIGIFSGILGVGGGFISLPFLIYILGAPTIVAVGTSLIIVFFTSCYGAFTYTLTGHVDWTTALVILVGSFLGIHLGVAATKTAAETRIKLLFALLLLCVAASVFLRQLELTSPGKVLVVSGALVLCFTILWPLIHTFGNGSKHRKNPAIYHEPSPDKMTKR